MTPEEVVGKILASPDIAASLQNPKVVEAIMDVCFTNFTDNNLFPLFREL